jgi:hypothetical protein
MNYPIPKLSWACLILNVLSIANESLEKLTLSHNSYKNAPNFRSSEHFSICHQALLLLIIELVQGPSPFLPCICNGSIDPFILESPSVSRVLI